MSQVQTRGNASVARLDCADEAISYRIVFQRQGHDIETLYWRGSAEETRRLARGITFRCGADGFRMVEFAGDAEQDTSLN